MKRSCDLRKDDLIQEDDDETTLIAEQELDIRLVKPQINENVLNNRGDLGT